jgi:Tol biopolymer transport system component
MGGQANISVRDFEMSRNYLISSSEVGYLRDASWSQDSKRLLMWSSQNNSILYVVNADGNELIERQLNVQIFGTPQFAPDNRSIFFYGADSSSTGLFEATLDGSQTRKFNALVENESGFAFASDGYRLAYMEMDRSLGEARLITEEITTNRKTVLATLPIPKGSGSSIPEVANLRWSPDRRMLVFEFGRSPSDRVVYLAFADGSELIKVADAAHAPAISSDGRCLAYIINKQVFLVDLADISSPSAAIAHVLLADLPTGKSIADFRLDKLQWRP